MGGMLLDADKEPRHGESWSGVVIDPANSEGTMMEPSHGKLHQAENQAHGREGQLPWRRGRLGLIIPLVTVVAAIAAVIYVAVTI